MTTQRGQHWLEREDAGTVTVARFRQPHLRGEESCRELFSLLYALVDEIGRTRLVLNLDRVQSLDSSAVGKLVLLNHKTQSAGGRLALCRLGAGVMQTFITMHLTGTFPIYDEEGQAVESFPPLPAPPKQDLDG